MTGDPATHAEEGFSLIEVLCAFVILSISAAIVLQTVQLAAKSSAMAQEKMKILTAVPKIELAITTAEAGNSSSPRGETDGLHWEIEPVPFAEEQDDEGMARLRVFLPDGERHYDFLINYRPRLP
ncbi:type II secretion system protein (plasmid) [Rhizobium lusitanum]|uniref:type II secretion system protein n=1 Tax=Rhizobium lusitanum TaxID=293958 RepID=UPI0016143399|nr:type II secretion system protein [Rhizobium lusitanum]QND46474.1 type II secretion system protein [Rhizobium lusitanum]